MNKVETDSLIQLLQAGKATAEDQNKAADLIIRLIATIKNARETIAGIMGDENE